MNRAPLIVLFGAALLAAVSALPVAAQRGRQAPPGPPNPFQGNAEAALAGQKVYEGNCLSCHAVNGGAGEIGPALVNAAREDEPRTPGQMFAVIKGGVPGTAMPGWSPQLSDDDIWRIVTYVQSLRGTAIDNPTPGNVAAGSAIFSGKGQCASCHTVDGKGGVFGPDLSNIASLRKTKQISSALTQEFHKIYSPGGDHIEETPTAGDWLPAKVVTADGQTITGVLINQDSYGLQMMGDDQKLHLFVRDKLRSISVGERSRMPTDYDKRLTPEEFRDLMAYLTRRGKGSSVPAVSQ